MGFGDRESSPGSPGEDSEMDYEIEGSHKAPGAFQLNPEELKKMR